MPQRGSFTPRFSTRLPKNPGTCSRAQFMARQQNPTGRNPFSCDALDARIALWKLATIGYSRGSKCDDRGHQLCGLKGIVSHKIHPSRMHLGGRAYVGNRQSSAQPTIPSLLPRSRILRSFPAATTPVDATQTPQPTLYIVFYFPLTRSLEHRSLILRCLRGLHRCRRN
jgi:hypothetical protein